MSEAESIEVAIKIGVYIVGLIVFVVGLKYTIQNLRNDHDRVSAQMVTIENKMVTIENKVDGVAVTLGEIKTNAARHDARAEAIQNAVGLISERVTWLEHKRD